jgi:hypothetical protein
LIALVGSRPEKQVERMAISADMYITRRSRYVALGVCSRPCVSESSATGASPARAASWSASRSAPDHRQRPEFGTEPEADGQAGDHWRVDGGEMALDVASVV